MHMPIPINTADQYQSQYYRRALELVEAARAEHDYERSRLRRLNRAVNRGAPLLRPN